MLGVRVTVPIACFRKGLAREFLETEKLPPPSTCYGFLLSLVGEEDRNTHQGVFVTPVLLFAERPSVVLRTLWRIKTKSKPLGNLPNMCPDYQQLLTNIELIIWIDSSNEQQESETLEQRVYAALTSPAVVNRFGGLSLGESTHLVDEVCLFGEDPNREGQAFVTSSDGSLSLPIWVDHIGTAGTRYATGDLVVGPLTAPKPEQMPCIKAD